MYSMNLREGKEVPPGGSFSLLQRSIGREVTEQDDSLPH